ELCAQRRWWYSAAAVPAIEIFYNHKKLIRFFRGYRHFNCVFFINQKFISGYSRNSNVKEAVVVARSDMRSASKVNYRRLLPAMGGIDFSPM
ncbi:hypothetical protein O5477_26555, partial [Escherichia coli]|nr:hypothetical protein [Escherichia coli]